MQSRARAKLLIAAGLLALTGFVFGQAAGFDWVRYDDGEYVYRSGPVTSGLSWDNFVWAFTHFHAHNWHPLTTLSHMLDCTLFGVNPHAHHLINVVIHGLAAVTLFFSLVSLTEKIWRCGFVAAVFATHPLRAESVAWIAERKDVLSGLCFAALLGVYGWYARKPTAWRFLLALSCAALGNLAKPMLVTIPFLLLLLDWWPLRRFTTVKWWRLLLEKIPFAGCATCSALATLHAQADTFNSLHAPPVLRLQNAIVSCAIYLRQLFWPVDLAVLYPHPESLFPWPVILGSTLLVGGVTLTAIARAKSRPWLFTGWFWFIGMLVPVMGIVQVGRQAHADRYTYLPLIGVVLAITWLISEQTAHWRKQGAICAGGSIIVLVALSACAYHQTGYWRNAQTLWPHTLAITANNDAAHLAFATALFAEGHPQEAAAHMHSAIAIRPSDAGAFGEVPTPNDKEQIQAATALWSERVAEVPRDPAARNTLGALLAQQHQVHAAVAEWNKALELAPGDGNAQSNLAWVLATSPDATMRDGRRAVTLGEFVTQLAGGANPLLQRTLAAAYAEAGRFEDAVAAAERGRALAAREGNRSLAVELTSNIAQYRQGIPLRDPSLTE